MNDYGEKELDIILTQLQQEFRLATTTDERNELRMEINYFKNELRSCGA